MTYKEVLEYFIRDLNAIISDPIANPEYKGGKFVLEIDVSTSGGEVNLRFIESDKDLLVFKRSFSSSRDDESVVYEFLRHCYVSVLRVILLTEDSVGKLKGIHDRPVNALSFKTLFKSGLSTLP